MADEFQTGVNWWDSSRKNRFDSEPSSTSTANFASIGSFGWATEAARSSMDSSVSVSGASSSVNFQDNQKLSDSDPSLQMMGLGLPSQAVDWNQSMLRGAKAEGSFQSMLQEDPMNSNPTFQQEIQWRPKIFSGCGEVSSMNQEIPNNFQIDNSLAVYGESPSNNNIMQSLFGPNHQPQQTSLIEGRSIDYPPYAASSYGMNTNELLQQNPISKFPPFMRDSPPKISPHTHLQFSNNGQYWNPSASPMPDVRSRFLPSLQPQFSLPISTFEEKPKVSSETRDSSSSVVKKGGNEVSTKRSRTETKSTLPPFKVRKEKMGDRITALQQLVSPFGKTDTASVLSEAIEYIKFLHEQVSVLSIPYMKNGAPLQVQHYQNSGKSKDLEGSKQDLKSRGICLVPVSSTFPVTHDQTTVDFWNPTFGGSFR